MFVLLVGMLPSESAHQSVLLVQDIWTHEFFYVQGTLPEHV